MKELQSGPRGRVPEMVYVFIETIKGGSQKYEFDQQSGVLFLDRDLFGSMVYPGDYGFVPQTLCKDGDPLDALVLVSQPHHPGVVIPAKPIALMEMEDEKGEDNKILCVPTKKVDPSFKEINDLDDVPKATINKIVEFFKHMKELEPGKWVKVKKWHKKEKAHKYILESIKAFNQIKD
jgi:inorganic pyrophosphatase